MSLTTTLLLAVFAAIGDDRFVNFESPQVHPLDINPSANLLAACNTANGTVDLFALKDGLPVFAYSVPVGIDPASARFRTDTELWVANWLSDSVSVIDVAQRNVVRTLQAKDEPADIAFSPTWAFVSCSQSNMLLVFELGNLDAPPRSLALHAKFPRALAVSEDGRHLYAATFQSGNKTTALAHDYVDALSPMAPERVISRPDGPHGGQNPPFNGNGAFVPPLAPGLPPPPPVDLIVRQDEAGAWRDDTGADWTRFVSGEDANLAGRVKGWQLPDHDIAVIDTQTLAVSYVSGLMNICAAIAPRPGTDEVLVVGTDAINEIRFEPNLTGRMVKAIAAFAAPDTAPRRIDLNAKHLDYSVPRVEPAVRARSIGEPRAIAWEADGVHAWIAGMGSSNVIRIDTTGNRLGDNLPTPVSAGPTGLALAPTLGKLYVLCRFGASIDTIDLASGTVAHRQPLYDPTPSAIRDGRPVLYDTHATSGLGQAACASCHVDARTDGLAWDLGDPQGPFKTTENRNLSRELDPSDADNYHPMKGPRTTQTLQDIIGHEPFHWSGDRDNLEAFSGAFHSLMGADAPLDAERMAQLKAFLATITFPPNPYRNLDNSLPESLQFEYMLAPAPPGEPRVPMPAANARRGLDIFLSAATDCSRCHTLPTGRGSHLALENGQLRPIPVRADGTVSLRVVAGANTKVQTVRKPAQLSGFYTKLGMDSLSIDGSTTGFGMLSAGAFDSLMRFLLTAAPHIGNLNLQQSADVLALLLAWGGSDFPVAATGEHDQPPGLPGRDSHAALGAQVTLPGGDAARARLNALVRAVEASPRIEMIATGIRGGTTRGWWLHDGAFEADTPGDHVDLNELVSESSPGSETTFTVVARGTGKRLGIDRDLDGVLNSADPSIDPVALNASFRDADLTNCAECEPSGLQLAEGDTLCLAVDAPGASGFMWSLRNRVFSDFDRVRGATTGRFQLAALTDSDRGMYRVDYFDAAGAPANQFFVVTVAPKGRAWPWIAAGGAAMLALVVLVRRSFRRRRG